MVSAVSGKQGVVKPSFITRARNFLTEVWVELKKARWPSQKELVNFTLVVVFTVIAVAVYIAFADRIMTYVSDLLGVFPKVTSR